MTLPAKTRFIVTTPSGDTLNVFTLSDLTMGASHAPRHQEFHTYVDLGEGNGDARISDMLTISAAVNINAAIHKAVKTSETITTPCGHTVTQQQERNTLSALREQAADLRKEQLATLVAQLVDQLDRETINDSYEYIQDWHSTARHLLNK